MRVPKGGVGFFDSGIGGLTVMAECRKYLPNEIFYYYGDNVHAPYGNLPARKIRRYLFAAMRYFCRLRVRAVVIACNTATAVGIEELRRRYPFIIIGAEPAVLPAARTCGKVYVLTTRATRESRRFQALCAQASMRYPKAVLHMFACEGLAGDIESNLLDPYRDYSAHLPKGNPDAVVLGCTHYIYIEEKIAKFYHCESFDGNAGIAKMLTSYLQTESKKEGGEVQKKKKYRDFRPRLTTYRKNEQKPNKSSQKSGKKCLKNASNKILFFLGKSRERNAFVYEQMFVFNKKG